MCMQSSLKLITALLMSLYEERSPGREHLLKMVFCCIKTSTEEHVWANDPLNTLLLLGKFSKDTESQERSVLSYAENYPLAKWGLRVYIKTLKILQHSPFCCAETESKRIPSVSSENCGSCCQSAVCRLDLSESWFCMCRVIHEVFGVVPHVLMVAGITSVL